MSSSQFLINSLIELYRMYDLIVFVYCFLSLISILV
nr:MAG TPA: hypothetical protein [Caudoviricetes sp.]